MYKCNAGFMSDNNLYTVQAALLGQVYDLTRVQEYIRQYSTLRVCRVYYFCTYYLTNIF